MPPKISTHHPFPSTSVKNHLTLKSGTGKILLKSGTGDLLLKSST